MSKDKCNKDCCLHCGTDYCRLNAELQAEKEKVKNFLSKLTDYIHHNGNPCVNLDEVFISIKDICKQNKMLDKNADKYKQSLKEIKEIITNSFDSAYVCNSKNSCEKCLQGEILYKIKEVIDADIQP